MRSNSSKTSDRRNKHDDGDKGNSGGRGHDRDDHRNHHWDQNRDYSDRGHGVIAHTRNGDDSIIGSRYRDMLFAGSGDDTVTGGGGNDILYGGRGSDTAVFSGSFLDYTIKPVGCGPWLLVSGPDGHDFLHRFETLQFADASFGLGGNNAPLAQLRGDGLTGNEDGAFDFALDVYDLEGGTVSVTSSAITGGGSVSVAQTTAQQDATTGSSSGLVVTVDPGNAYETLGAGEIATETVTIELSDGQGGTTTLTYTVTIEGVNDTPVARAVTATALEDGPAVAIAAAYTDVDATDTHTVTVDTTGTLGAVIDNGDGTFSYDPNSAFETLAPGESTTDSFTFTVDDGNGGTDTETVTVTIQGQNDAPIVAAISGSTGEEGSAITLAADFSDVDGSDSHTFSVDTTGTLGAVTDNGDGTFSYDPNGAFEALGCHETATDTFTYTVDDGNGGSSTQSVVVTITGTNDAPVVSGTVTASVTEADAPLTLDLLANASDIEGDTLAIANSSATASDGRSLLVSVDETTGTLTLDPGQFDDLAAGESATVTVAYDVFEADRAYEGTSGAETLDNAGTFFIADNDTGTLIRVKRSPSVATAEQAIAVAGVENGTLVVIDGNSTGVGISPRAIHDGVVSTVGVDGVSLGSYTGPTTVDSLEVPARYVLVGGDMTNETVTVEIPYSDADCGDMVHSFTIPGVSQGNGISYTTPQIGGVTLLAAPEGVAASAEIIVNGVNDAPEAQDLAAATDEDGPALTLGADYSDVDRSDTHTVTVDDSRVQGLVTNNGDGTFSYDPNGAFDALAVGETGTETFSYTVDDGQGSTDTATVTVTVTGQNDAVEIDAASSDLSATVRAGTTRSMTLSPQELLSFYTGSGPADLISYRGEDVMRVLPGNGYRVIHTEIDLFAAGELTTDDTVSITLTGGYRYGTGDQDSMIGLTDGDWHMSIFTREQGGVYLLSDDASASGSLAVLTGSSGSDSAFVTSPRIEDYSLSYDLDGASDAMGINVPVNGSLSAGDDLDPANGLSVFLGTDEGDETHYYTGMTIAAQVAATEASGQIVFSDLDTSDVQTASVTGFALSGDTAGINASAVEALFSIATDASSSAQGGNVDWTFATDGSLFTGLAANESVTASFDITVDDGQGSTATETVSVTVDGLNDAPQTTSSSLSISEPADIQRSAGIGYTDMPNSGRWYIYDFDTNQAQTVLRDFSNLYSEQQVADAYLSNGNGLIVHPNPNNTGWTFGADLFVDGVQTKLDSDSFEILDIDGGSFSLTDDAFVAFPEDNEEVKRITIAVNDVELSDGRIVSAKAVVNDLDYETTVFAVDDLDVQSVQFSSVIEQPSPLRTIHVSSFDPDGDTLVFELDTTETLGEVINNQDGSFTYDASAFDYLNTGQTATDSFVYTVTDGHGGLAVETVDITLYGATDIVL
ncbi:Ig-like domain-containing protein [Phaeobacter sp. HF9A]|uniref:tandem-95 repeat protein n=1 Tax=Phaeobacter sp. HF9A TaxID=2721561 RepID=UPI0014313C19|nr:Ig-like domain-containing protein [Phaeobacter sp. HF9A]NIZ11892.1 tandem-95 repeat protein [Phaeobacter sp. HF9A]